MTVAEKKKLNKKILKTYFEDIAYEDYSYAENNGHVDHEGRACKGCSLLFDYEDYPTASELLKHFYAEHYDLVSKLKEVHE